MKQVADELARWASEVRWQMLPPRIQEFARLVWLDTHGSMLLGASHEETIALAQTLAARNTEGRTASAVGPKARLTPLDAILVNGVATGVDVFDGGNLDSKGHVAGYVMPGILTAAEQTGASLADTLAAFVVAYEVASRIGASQDLRSSMHPSSTWNIIGAAAGVGYLRGMNAEQLAQAMALAANLTIVTSWQAAVHGATVRDLYHAIPGYLGMMIPDLVAAGFRGGPRSIEITFGDTLSSQAEFKADLCVADFGKRWLFDRTYLKVYPNCRSFHGALDALFEALAALPGGFDLATDTFRAGTDPNAYKDNREAHNETMLAARESLPASIAIGALFGSLGPEIYRSGKFADPRVLPLAQSVVVEEAKRNVPDERPGWVEISRNGKVAVRREVRYPIGNPENQIPPDAVRTKFIENARPVLGTESESVADAILSGDLNASFRDLFPRWIGAGVLR